MEIKKVLVIDDSSTMQRILTKKLEEAGFPKMVTAKDGKDAMDVLARDSSISLILCDWNMPRMSGIEFLQILRASKNFKNLPFIMVTSRNAKEDIMEAIKAGANNYIIKPFTAEGLKEKISSLG